MGFTVREVAKQLQVSTATVYGWMKAGSSVTYGLGGTSSGSRFSQLSVFSPPPPPNETP